jgi:hypothetical protein
MLRLHGDTKVLVKGEMLEPRALPWVIKGEARVGGKLCFGLAR